MDFIKTRESEAQPAVADTHRGGAPNSTPHPDGGAIERLQSTVGNAMVARAVIKGQTGGASVPATARETDLRTAGNFAMQQALRSGLILAKLSISRSDDLYEQEADRVASIIMRMPEPTKFERVSGEQKNGAGGERKDGRATGGPEMVQRKPLISRITSFIQRHVKPLPGTRSEREVRAMTSAELPGSPTSVEDRLKNTRGRGEPLSSAARDFFEPRFGTDLAHVRIHTDNDAGEMNRAVAAKAFSHGSDIYYGTGNSPADFELTAHELTHVLQQTSDDAVTPDEPAIQRTPVTTNGGTFDTTLYDPVHAPTGAVGDRLGANMRLEFTANDLVESTKIGLVQSTKAMTSSIAGGLRNTVATGVGDPDEAQLIMGPGQVDPGREIDVAVHPVSGAPLAARPAPSTSPIYSVGYATGGGETTLSQGAPSVGTSQWGSHTKDPTTHIFLPAVAARIEDGPGRIITFAGQTFEHTFEVAALAVEGPIPVNTYLGTVSWGWRSDAVGQVTLLPMALAQAGAPSAAFMGAAALWNSATLHNTATGATVASIDIPITSLDSGTVAAADMSTNAIVTRIALVDSQLAGLAPGPERTNKEFEKRALEAELSRRFLKINVRVNTTEDWGSDNVYVKVTGPGGNVSTTGVRDLNNGDSHDFTVPLVTHLPLSGPFRIQVYDEDWPDADDLIVDMNFAAPWAPAHNTRSMDEANYDVTVVFER